MDWIADVHPVYADILSPDIIPAPYEEDIQYDNF